MTGKQHPETWPVFDPEIDEDDRTWLLDHRDLLWTSGEPGAVQPYGLSTPDGPMKGVDDHIKAMGLVALPLFGLIVVGLLLQREAGRSAWVVSLLCRAGADISFFAAAIFLVCAAVLGTALMRARRVELSQRYALALVASMRECYVLPDVDLDDECKALFARARTAGWVINGAQADGLGLTSEHRKMLPTLLWQLAVDMAALTEQAAIWALEGAEVTREMHTARILTLAGARGTMEERVAAIEAHADRINVLDREFEDALVVAEPADEDPMPQQEEPAPQPIAAHIPEGATAAETTWLLPVIVP